MPFVSITRLKVKSIIYLYSFIRANENSVKQISSIPGFISGKELIDKNLTFWTLTIWKDEVSMRQFRNSIPHKTAMQKLPYWCSEASYFHWTKEDEELPDWKNASTRLINEGFLTKVRSPTKRQQANSFPPIKWTRFERVFQSKKSH